VGGGLTHSHAHRQTDRLARSFVFAHTRHRRDGAGSAVLPAQPAATLVSRTAREGWTFRGERKKGHAPGSHNAVAAGPPSLTHAHTHAHTRTHTHTHKHAHTRTHKHTYRRTHMHFDRGSAVVFHLSSSAKPTRIRLIDAQHIGKLVKVRGIGATIYICI
jgi:hypothetical protein